MPKHTRQTVSRWFSPAALSTIKKMHTASGPPNCADREQVRVRSGDEGAHAEDEVRHHDEDWRRKA